MIYFNTLFWSAKITKNPKKMMLFRIFDNVEVATILDKVHFFEIIKDSYFFKD